MNFTVTRLDIRILIIVTLFFLQLCSSKLYGASCSSLFQAMSNTRSSKAFLAKLKVPVPVRTSDGSHFIRPNERHPEDALPILFQTSQGAYIAVGAERGFIGAALSKSTHLILTDIDRDVARYNSINVALLKASTSLSDYLQLRYASNPSIWKSKSKEIIDETNIILNDSNAWLFWNTWQSRQEKLFDPSVKEFFKEVNYLKDPVLFNKLQTMAKQGRIKVLHLSYNSQESIDLLVNAISESGIKLSVLDISNAWYPAYISPPNFKFILDKLLKISSPQSLLLVTRGSDSSGWDYMGFKMNEINEKYNGAVPDKALSLLYSSGSHGPNVFKPNSINLLNSTFYQRVQYRFNILTGRGQRR